MVNEDIYSIEIEDFNRHICYVCLHTFLKNSEEANMAKIRLRDSVLEKDLQAYQFIDLNSGRCFSYDHFQKIISSYFSEEQPFSFFNGSFSLNDWLENFDQILKDSSLTSNSVSEKKKKK